MKRLFTLLFLSALLGAAVQAQTDRTFIFTDLDGNEVADGAEITVNVLNEEGQMVVPLLVKNISGAKAAASLYETIDDKPNGTWQTCAFGNCITLSGSGYSPKNVMAADYKADIQTEWIPTAGQYASWTAKLQLHIFNITSTTLFGQKIETAGNEIIGYGPTVTVNFVYAEQTNISRTTASEQTITDCYTIGGQRSSLRHGLNIVRTADGRVVKRIVK